MGLRTIFLRLSLMLVTAAVIAMSYASSAIAASRNQLNAGDALSWRTPCPPQMQCPAGYDTVTSSDGSTTLSIAGSTPNASGGTLVLDGPNVSWSSSVGGAVVAVMQGDGNFVVFNAAGTQIWSTGTSGHPGAVLKVDRSEATIQTDPNTVIWRGTYTAQGQCQAASQAAVTENLKVTLDSSDAKSFATALQDPTVAKCEAMLLANATAALPTAACAIAQTMPLDPLSSPAKAAAAALQQANGDAGAQFYTNCYSPYIAAQDRQSCANFCTNPSNLKACNFSGAEECENNCFGSRPVGSNCPVLVRTPSVPSPYGPASTNGLPTPTRNP